MKTKVNDTIKIGGDTYRINRILRDGDLDYTWNGNNFYITIGLSGHVLAYVTCLSESPSRPTGQILLEDK